MAAENPAFAINPRNVPRPYKTLYREVFASEIDMFPEVFEAFRLGEHETRKKKFDKYKGIVHSLYGSDSKVTNKEFARRLSLEENNWVFDSRRIRTKFELMTQPGILGDEVII